jgi:DNA-binding NarL/FixJ family response regulator
LRNPYVTGAYVTGPRFYGRAALLDYLLNGSAHAYWLIGTRRIGKTSTLRQLESLALSDDARIPVFWDMQGADSFARLGQYLADAIGTYGPRFAPLGLSPMGLGEEPLQILRSLRRAMLAAGRELLLLCDETEALLKIARNEPEAVQRLHRELTDGAGLRVVMASTRGIFQLHDICADWPTSPFLEGFDLSQTLGSLSSDAVRALILQAQMPARQRVSAEPEVIEAIQEATNGHPYLVQVMCSRLFQEDGTLRAPLERDFSVEPTLRGFFNHDFNALTPSERAILLAVHAGDSIDEMALAARIPEPTAELHRRIHALETLGYLRRNHQRITIGSRYLANYLLLRPESLARMPGSRASEDAVKQTLSRQQAEESEFLVHRLNDRRARLLKLESLRARRLLKTSNATLAEIEQVESEIRRLRRRLAEVQSAPVTA